MRTKLKLGMEVEDRVTGFSGIVTALAVYITGSSQASVQPRTTDGKNFTESRWFDVERLSITNRVPIALTSPDKTKDLLDLSRHIL